LVVVAGISGIVLCVLATAQEKVDPKPAAAGSVQKAQDPAKRADEPQVFTSQTQEVIVPVTVKDLKGRYLSNLAKEDFRILDEGRPQKITFFSHADKQPIVVGFLVDQSNTMRIHWDKYKEAIRELVWSLLPGDPRFSGYLIQYNTKAELLVNTTTDSDKIAETVAKMKPSGGAALFDAIYRACTDRTLVKGEPYEPRRIIIIIGDGHDTSTQKNMAEVLELAKRNLVTIFAMSTMSFGFENPDREVLEKLANETGGHVEYPLNGLYKNVPGQLSHPSDEGNYAITPGTGGYSSEISSHIMQAIADITGDITMQYILRYSPDIDPLAKPKEFRRINVEIPRLQGVSNVWTRDGYYPNAVKGAVGTAQ
jgi:VWFA-related protein